MLRLTRWIADYYLCDWAAVLDAVVPAGVRGEAGTRMTTLLTRRRRTRWTRLAEAEAAGEAGAKCLKVLAAADEPLTPGELARAADVHARPRSPRCGAKG